MKDDIVRYSPDVPAEMDERIKREAAFDRRSKHMELIVLVSEALEARERKAKAKS